MCKIATKNIHDGHRRRVRDRFLKEQNYDNYPEHNILELLLFYSIPRGDTNVTAHNLIERFGSIEDALNAPAEALMEVKGVGEHTVMLFRLISEIIKRSIKSPVSNMKQLTSDAEVFEYLQPVFRNSSNEKLVMISLNNTGKILRTTVISEGACDFACVDTRKIAQEIIFSNAKQVIIAHNHPGGICAPSQSDIAVTRQLAPCPVINHAISTSG